MMGSAAAGDYDNDGWVDIYATRFEAPNLLFHNLGDGTFEEVGATAGVDLISRSSAVVWGDVNNDGHLDLLVLTLTNRHYLYLSNGDGTFNESADAYNIALRISPDKSWTSAAFGDYDHDGDLDLHLAGWHFSGLLNQLHRNENGSGFADVTTAANAVAEGTLGFSTRFADVTGDGWVDLLLAADFETSRLFENMRNGTFNDITIEAGVGDEENGMGSTIGDIDNDGDLDWFVTSIYDPDVKCSPLGCNVGWGGTGNRLYQNDGTGSFTDGTSAWGVRNGAWGWGTSFLDFDNDGRLDLAETNGINFTQLSAEDQFQHLPVRLWHNNGPSATPTIMQEVGASLGFTSALEGKGLLTLDYDNDGDQDVLIINNADHPVLYRNDGGNTNPYIKIDPRGTTSNHFGIGATVRITVGDVRQMRLIGANSNFMGQNDRIAHFGLGPETASIDTITIEWPASAVIQKRNNVATNQLLKIQEPIPGDFQDDNDVDLEDYALLFACHAPPQSGERPANHCARSTDLRDIAIFQNAFTGSNDE